MLHRQNLPSEPDGARPCALTECTPCGTNEQLATMRHSRDPISVDDEVTRHARTRLGSLVRDRWHLDALLGVGGMAAVYAATHRNNGKRVAIKMLHPELSTNREIRQRFIDEGYAANRVGHPGAVSVLDDDVAEDGAAFLVMDLLEGETLEARLQRLGRLEPLQVLAITDALLDVLAAAHAEGIVHRDIKPDNIFITTEGVVMLLDFGIARMVMEGRPRTTLSGATMGTPAFMAPEQARGRWEDLDGRTDLWAVGATMFVQLTGRVVHLAETTNEELLSAMTKAAPSLGEIAPALPSPLIALVDRALAFEQRDRWSDARTMQAEVRALYTQLRNGNDGGESQTELIPSTSPLTFATPRGQSIPDWSPAHGRRRTALVAVAALAAAALVGATFALRAGGPSRTTTSITTVPHLVADAPRADDSTAPSPDQRTGEGTDTNHAEPERGGSPDGTPAGATVNARSASDAREIASASHPALRRTLARPAKSAVVAPNPIPRIENEPSQPAVTVLPPTVALPALAAPAAPAATPSPAASSSDPLARRK
jgi:serine/threonine protein kinase